MSAVILLILAALAASLPVRTRTRLWPAIATAASGLIALFALGLVSFAVKGVPLGLLLAATLTAAGVTIWPGGSERRDGKQMASRLRRANFEGSKRSPGR